MFFLFIFIIILILVFAIHTSRIGIEIENLNINIEEAKGKKINEDRNIYVYLLIFGKKKLFKRSIKNINRENIKFKNENLKINYKVLLQNIEVKQINLYVEIGTQNAALTAISVGIIASILGIILRKPKYEILPIYLNKNFLKIKLDGIFLMNLMQYIYILIFNKIKEFWKKILKRTKIFQNKKVEV